MLNKFSLVHSAGFPYVNYAHCIKCILSNQLKFRWPVYFDSDIHFHWPVNMCWPKFCLWKIQYGEIDFRWPTHFDSDFNSKIPVNMCWPKLSNQISYVGKLISLGQYILTRTFISIGQSIYVGQFKKINSYKPVKSIYVSQLILTRIIIPKYQSICVGQKFWIER